MTKKPMTNFLYAIRISCIVMVILTSCPEPAAAAGTCGTGTWTPGQLEIHHINIGQGDAALIVGPTGRSLLFDAGETNWNSSARALVTGSYVESVLGCTVLDYAVITHFHLDHVGYTGYGGLWHLVEVQGFTIGATLVRDYSTYLGDVSSTFTKWRTYLEGTGAAKLHPVTAQEGAGQVDLGPGVVFDIVALDGNGAILPGDFSGEASPPSENDYSLGALIRYGEFDEWIGGDLDGQYEINQYGYAYHDIEVSAAPEVGDVDVYKVNHHASSHSSSATFINQIDPEVSVVTVGDGNSYGHPAQVIMDRLLATSTVYMTERGNPDTDIGSAMVAGDIVIKTSNGVSYTVNGTPYTATEPIRVDADSDGYFAEADPDDSDANILPSPNGGCDPVYQTCSNSCEVNAGEVLINEVLPYPTSGTEWVELYNTTDDTINIGYCFIDDIAGGSAAYQIPASILVPAHGLWTLDRNSYFNNSGDEVRLLKEDASTILDSFTYGNTANDLSWYRLPDGSSWAGTPTASTTKGQTNTLPFYPIVLSVLRTDPNNTDAGSVDFTLNFSKTVSGVDVSTPFSDFVLTTTGLSGAAVAAVNGSDSTYTITVNTGTGNGTIRLDVVDDNTIIDSAGKSLGGANPGDGNFTGGQTYTIIKDPSAFLNCSSQTEIPEAECDALVALYNSTNGSAWNDNTGWLQTKTPCSWFGITCGNGTNVTEVDLAINNLIGTIPPQLGNLTSLQALYLGVVRAISIDPEFPSDAVEIGKSGTSNMTMTGNQLTGGIPPELGNLTNLNYLVLSDNLLTGSIPSQLGNLSALRLLALDGNHLTGAVPPELGNLSDLEGLYLRFNQLSGSIPPELGNLVNLRQLALSRNQLNGAIPPELGKLLSLNYLVLNNNNLSGNLPPEMGGMTGLELLILSDNQLSGSIPPELGSLTNLTWMYLDGNHLSGEFPAAITNLVNLSTITFDCGLTASDPLVAAFIEALVPGWQNNICPIVLSITRSDPSPTSSSLVNFMITFSEAVSGVNFNPPFGDFNLTATGITGAAITGVNGSGATYTISVNSGSGSGTIRLDVVDDDTIINAISHPLGGAGIGNGNFAIGEEYFIVRTKPNIPLLISPQTGKLLDTLRPTLDWKDSNPVLDHYQLQVSTNNTFTGLVLDRPDILASDFTFTSDLNPGKRYYWRVRSFNILDQTKGWSTPWNFKTPLATPTLDTPACGASLLTDRPAFDWLDVEGAAGYTLQVSPATSFGTLLLNAAVPASEYTMSKDLPQNKTLYWRVRAQTPVVFSTWSEKCSFTTGNPPTVPILASPANNALVKDYTPTLKWYKSVLPSGTLFKRYELQLDNNSDFSSHEIEFSTSEGVLSETTFTPPSDLTPNTKYYWRVRAVNLAGVDEHASGWAVRSFRTVMLPPTLLLPVDGSTVGTLKPPFDWDDVDGAASYTIQISTSLSFGTFLVNTKVTVSNFTPATNLPKNKVIYWRVRANGPNGPSAWSVFQFTTPP